MSKGGLVRSSEWEDPTSTEKPVHSNGFVGQGVSGDSAKNRSR
jgi:hypothetical protein